MPPKIAPKTKIAVIIVVNYYCKNGCSQRESNPQLALRRRLLYPFNYENECRIFGLFSLFGIGNHIYESNHSRDELPLFLILTSQAPLLESNSKFIPFSFQRVQPWLNLRRRLLYPFNYENKCRIFKLFSLFGSDCHIYESNHLCDELPVFYSKQRLPCIQMFPLKRLPIAGSPSISFSLMQISNTISLHSMFIA